MFSSILDYFFFKINSKKKKNLKISELVCKTSSCSSQRLMFLQTEGGERDVQRLKIKFNAKHNVGAKVSQVFILKVF